MNPKRDQQRGESQRPLAEWIVAGASLVLVLAALGFLIYDSVATPPTGPEVTVRVDSIVARRANFVVHLTARNLGGSTGENVQISGELQDSADARGVSASSVANVSRIGGASSPPVERSIAVVHFLPPKSTRSGGLFFVHDPRRYRLSLRAEGFTSP